MYHFVGKSFCLSVSISAYRLLTSGTQYMTAPAFGSLQPVYKKIAFSFAIPTIIFLGALYCVNYSTLLHSPQLNKLPVRFNPFHLLQDLRRLPPPLLQHLHRLGDLVFHHRSYMGSSIRHRRSHPLLLRYALPNVIPLRWLVRLHLLGRCLFQNERRSEIFRTSWNC